MSLPEILHPAIHALPDVTLAVDRQSLRIVDVNRSSGAFGYARAELVSLGLDALTQAARHDLARLVGAADGAPMALVIGTKAGAASSVSARASAADAPYAFVTLRESTSLAGLGDRAMLREEIERVRGALNGLLARLEPAGAPTMPTPMPTPTPSSSGPSEIKKVEAPAPVAPPLVAPIPVPGLTLEQYMSLTVESDLHPAQRHEINARYGLSSDAARTELDRIWAERTARDAGLAERSRTLFTSYRAWFEAQARGPAAVAPPPVGRTTQKDEPSPDSLAQSSAGLPFASHAAAPVRARPAEPAAQATPDAPPVSTHHVPLEQPTDDFRRAARATVGVVVGPKGALLPFKPAEVPDLSVEQYAAMMAELGGYPDRQIEIRAMYGIHDESTFRACETHWTARLAADPPLRQKWLRLVADFAKSLVKLP